MSFQIFQKSSTFSKYKEKFDDFPNGHPQTTLVEFLTFVDNLLHNLMYRRWHLATTPLPSLVNVQNAIAKLSVALLTERHNIWAKIVDFLIIAYLWDTDIFLSAYVLLFMNAPKEWNAQK